MPDLSIGPVDYTSRDYAALRDDVIAAVQARVPEWGGASDPNDYLRVLLEGFAFIGDVTNYYIDRAANDAFLPTATSRQSLLNIAQTFGYAPSGPIAAAVTLTLTNSSASPVVVPAGSTFTGTYNLDGTLTVVTFETQADATVPASGNVDVFATEGATQRGSTSTQTNGDPIGILIYRSDGAGTSNGTPNQSFLITQFPVTEGSVRVWVHPPSGSTAVADGVEYTQVDHLVDATPNDRVYQLLRNADDSVSIVFGDGANGFVPPSGYSVRATYRLGKGAGGNVAATLINTLGSTPTGTALPVTLGVSNALPAYGGVDSESNDAIRDKTFRSVRTGERVVTPSDFEDFAVKQAGVAQAKALGSALSNVLIYVAPFSEQSDDQPGYTSSVLTVSNVAHASAVSTITTLTPHGLNVGDTIVISGTVFPFNGVWTVKAVPTSTTLTFDNPYGTTVASAAAAGKMTYISSSTASFTALKAGALASFQSALPLGTIVTVSGPFYTDLAVHVTLNLSAAVRQSVVKNAVTNALLSEFDASVQTFANTVYPSDVIAAAVGVDGVLSAQVTTFDRASTYYTAASTAGTASYENAQSALVGAPYEIFRLTATNLVLTMVGGISDLS